jgi:tryptophan-rich sensory protein
MADPEAHRPNPVIVLLVILTVCYGVGFVAAIATNASLPFWYITLSKPAWAPPGWVFAPVWTVLYGLMGWAAWLVWSVPNGEQPSGRRTRALIMFFVQLFLNGLWSWIFFGWHLLNVAMLEIGILWLAILATLMLFYRVRPLAGALFVPYLLWVTYAAALNLAIMRMNP